MEEKVVSLVNVLLDGFSDGVWVGLERSTLCFCKSFSCKFAWVGIFLLLQTVLSSCFSSLKMCVIVVMRIEGERALERECFE